jgi:hypothetical protein
VPRGQLACRSCACTGRLIIAAGHVAGPTHVAGLVQAQAEYAAWLENLPDSLQDGATAEALRTICDLDLSELQAIIPPRGFGRD